VGEWADGRPAVGNHSRPPDRLSGSECPRVRCTRRSPARPFGATKEQMQKLVGVKFGS